MIDKKLINPTNTALIVVDIQNDYCSSTGKIAQTLGVDLTPVQKVVPEIISFVDVARRNGLPIIFTQMIEDPEYMDENAKLKKGNKAFCTPNTEGFEYYKIRPEGSDYQIIKKTYDAFSNPELEAIFKKNQIKNLIVIGAYTAVCVDTTIRAGFTRGYHIVVPENLVGMPKERIDQHEAALKVWKIIFAHVVDSKEIVDSWSN